MNRSTSEVAGAYRAAENAAVGGANLMDPTNTAIAIFTDLETAVWVANVLNQHATMAEHLAEAAHRVGQLVWLYAQPVAIERRRRREIATAALNAINSAPGREVIKPGHTVEPGGLVFTEGDQ